MAYLLLPTITGNEAAGWKADLVGARKGRGEQSSRDAGRSKWVATMMLARRISGKDEKETSCREVEGQLKGKKKSSLI